MKFHIGGHTYQVVVIPETKIDKDGSEWRGGVETKDREVQLFAPSRDRVDVFLHEYWHLWQIHLGRKLDEGECDRFATAVAALLTDLSKQGGVLALLALGADGKPLGREAADFALPANCGPRQCLCGQTIAAGSVICRPSGPDPKLGIPTVIVHFYCDFCGKVMRTREAATLGHKPTGAVLEVLPSLTGAAADAFCREHAEKIGDH